MDMTLKSKIQEAGDILKRFCEEDGYQFLWECGGLDHGFLDGGCKLLADAIMSIRGSTLADKSIFFVGRSDPDGSVDHVAVGFIVDSRMMYLDANGLQTEEELIQNLRNELNLSEQGREIEVDFFDEWDEDFMAKVEDSGFALYPDLDLVRKELVKKLEEIGFTDSIRPNLMQQEKRPDFFDRTSSSNIATYKKETSPFKR